MRNLIFMLVILLMTPFWSLQAVSGVTHLPKSNTADPVECLISLTERLATKDFKHVSKRKEIAEAICTNHAVYKIPYQLIFSLIWVESTFKIDAVSGGSYGLMQINTRYHKGKGINTIFGNVQTGVAYLRKLLDETGSIKTALSRYNGGKKNTIYATRVNQAYLKFFS